MKYSEITEKIIGCAMKVHKEPGFGFQKYIYHGALEIELTTSHLKAPALEMGLLFNFGAASLQFKGLYNKKYKRLFPKNP